MSHIVVIGYGMVGSRFVEDLTTADHAGEQIALAPVHRVLRIVGAGVVGQDQGKAVERLWRIFRADA